MKLWLARHGDAGPNSADPTKERGRPLTADGRKIVAAVAKAMKDAGEIPRVIFASNYQRTAETADIYGKTLGAPVDLVDELAPHMPVRDLVDTLLADDDSSRVMIVGHTDNLSPLYAELTGDDDADDFVKAEVRRLKVDRSDGEAKEKWCICPSDLGFEDEA